MHSILAAVGFVILLVTHIAWAYNLILTKKFWTKAGFLFTADVLAIVLLLLALACMMKHCTTHRACKHNKSMMSTAFSSAEPSHSYYHTRPSNQDIQGIQSIQRPNAVQGMPYHVPVPVPSVLRPVTEEHPTLCKA